MKKTLLSIGVVAVILGCSANEIIGDVKGDSKSKMVTVNSQTYDLEQPVDLAHVKRAVKGIIDTLKTDGKDGRELKGADFMSMRGRLEWFINHPNLELDTRIQRDWFKNLDKLLEYMGKLKNLKSTAILNGKREQVTLYEQKYDKAFEAFKTLVKKPAKISSERYQKLKKAERRRGK